MKENAGLVRIIGNTRLVKVIGVLIIAIWGFKQAVL